MSASAFDAVVGAFLALARTAPALASGNVYEAGELDVLPEGKGQGLFVGMEGSSPQPVTLLTAPLDWQTIVRVDIVVRIDKRGADGALSCSDILAKLNQRVTADPTLGGVAVGAGVARVNVNRDRLETNAVALTALFAVDHRSTHDTLEPA
jgi:hypothetical protein